MKIDQLFLMPEQGLLQASSEPNEAAQLALIFGGRKALEDPGFFPLLRALYPKAHLFGCSTAGEIGGTRVSDDSLVITTVEFRST